MHRSFDVRHLTKIMKPYKDGLHGFEEESWLCDKNNIALTDGLSNYFLFEYLKDRTHIGHYFLTSRGKKALALSEKALSTLFSSYQIDTILGLTPEENRKAKWFSRQLGFKSDGKEETTAGICEVFVLTKAEWLKRNN